MSKSRFAAALLGLMGAIAGGGYTIDHWQEIAEGAPPWLKPIMLASSGGESISASDADGTGTAGTSIARSAGTTSDSTSASAKGAASGTATSDADATASSRSAEIAAADTGFDAVELAIDGVSILAGRAAPGSSIEVTANGLILGRTIADAAGAWTIASAQKLPAGAYRLELIVRETEDGAPILTRTIEARLGTPSGETVVADAGTATAPTGSEEAATAAAEGAASGSAAGDVGESAGTSTATATDEAVATGIGDASAPTASGEGATAAGATDAAGEAAKDGSTAGEPTTGEPTTGETVAGGSEIGGSAAGGSAASGPETAAGAGSGGGTVGDATTRGSTDSEGQAGGTQAGKPTTTTTDGTATVPAGDATSADDTAAGAKTGEAATGGTGAGEDGIPEPSSSLIEKAGEMAAEVSRRFSNWFGTEADKADALAISTVSYRLLGPRAGEATISGRAPLGLEVRLAIDGTDVGITRAGENGRFLYEATYWLSPGPHTATAEAVDSAGRTVLETEFSFDRERQQADDAVVADADAGGKTAAPGEADGSGSAAGAGTARPVPSADGFAIRSILYESLGQKRGRVTVSGSGAPDADVRVVIDDDDIGMTRSDATGAWVLDSDYWVRPGTHGVRAELLAPNGDTIAGLDQEFRREAAMADAGAAGGSLASADDAAGSPALTGESQKADGEAAASDAPLEIAGATTSARQLRKPGRKSFKRRTLKAGTVAAARRHASRRATRAGWSQKRRRAAAVAARHSTHKTVRILRGTKREVVRVPVGRRLWSRRHGFLSEGGRRYHRVRRGDTLWGIARRYYGRGSRYPRIYGANRRRIRNPDLIYPRQRLLIP